MLPSVFGECSEGRRLSPLLPPFLAVYGIRLQGDQAYWDGCDTLADIAAGFVGELIEAVPNGPYILVGYSFAGRVAFEMAKQMQTKSLAVELVILLDSKIGTDPPDTWTWITRDLPSIVANLPGLLLDDFHWSPRTIVDRVRRKLRRWYHGRGAAGARTVADDSSVAALFLDTSQLSEFYKTRMEISVRAAWGYRPSMYRGRVAVIKSKILPFIHRALPDMGWGRWVDGVVEVRTVSGNHGNMLLEPRIRGVAEVIAALIEARHASCSDRR